MKKFSFAVLIAVVLTLVISVPAFAAEESSDSETVSYVVEALNYPVEYMSSTNYGDTIVITVEDAFYVDCDISREGFLAVVDDIPWNFTFNDTALDGVEIDSMSGRFSFPYVGDGVYRLFVHDVDWDIDAKSYVTRVVSVVPVLQSVANAGLTMASTVATTVIQTPLLLLGVVVGVVGLGVGLFKRLRRV